MKKLLALLVFSALLLSMTACFYENKKDPSASPLEEYTSGELRVLMGEARYVASKRISERGSEYLEAFEIILRENGYQLDTRRVFDNCYKFTDPNNPSFLMDFYYSEAWAGAIEGDITDVQVSKYFCCLLEAIAHVEGHPKEKSVEEYSRAIKEDIPFGNMLPNIYYKILLDGYYCRVKYEPATADEAATYYFQIE